MSLLKKIWIQLFNPEIPPSYFDTLQQFNAYFRALDEANQQIFLERLAIFIQDVKFFTEPNYIVTTSMKVIISSAFIQITFGLKKFTLDTYGDIFIAPRPYRYKGVDGLLGGDVNTINKRISLAWPTVVKGFAIEDDAINIAIHEFGHCLVIENFSRPYIGAFLKNKDWEAWLIQANAKLQTIKAGKNEFIRNYGGSNTMEMFAVSLESFFERPQTFSNKLPNLYNSLKNLLRQDPMQSYHPQL